MALEDLTGSDKFISSLVITNPLASDDRREGDDHIRGIKNVLKNTFPEVEGVVHLDDYYLKTGGPISGAADVAGQLTIGDGTVAAPGWAFKSDPAFGWYRNAASQMGLAAGGLRRIAVSAGAGDTAISVLSGANPEADASATLGLDSKGIGIPRILATKAGVMRWALQLGDSQVEAGANAGSNFRITRYADGGAPLGDIAVINRATGALDYGGLANFTGRVSAAGVTSSAQLQVTAGGATITGATTITGTTTVTGSVSVSDDLSGKKRIIGGGFGTNGLLLLCRASDSAATGSVSVGANSGNADNLDLNGQAKTNIYAGGTLMASVDAAANWRFLAPSVRFTNIGTVAVSGNAYVEGGDENRIYRATSSLRYKRDVKPMAAQASEFIYQLEPIFFRMKDDPLDPSWSYYGFAAEQLDTLEPRFVHYTVDDQAQRIPDGVQYDRLVVPLVAELKKLRERVATLEQFVGWGDAPK